MAGESHNIDAALALCRDPHDEREICQAPFRSVVDGRPCRIATDGKKMLAVDDLGAPEPATPARPAPQPALTHSGPATCTASRDDLIAWAGHDMRRPCPECAAAMKDANKCAECSSTGTVICDYDHEHECPKCRGAGKLGTKCDACHGSGSTQNDYAPISIPALPITLDAHLIGGLIDLLPGDEIGIVPGPLRGAIAESVAFRGPGWLLIVLGLRATESLRSLQTSPALVPAPQGAP